MCNPAGEEEGNVGSAEVSGIKLVSTGMNEVACVIEHHNYHDDAAQQVDRIDSTHSVFAGDCLLFHSVQDLESNWNLGGEFLNQHD